MTKIRIAIFASGTGSNAVNLMRFFQGHDKIEIAFVLSNKKDAPVLLSAQKLNVPIIICSNSEASDGNFLAKVCRDAHVDWIVLAGYLRLIPASFIDEYQNKIINLHPSLLPKYGGKGMHGSNVHEAVLANQDEESGITIHFIDAEFDRGKIIAQFHCSVEPDETIETLAAKIHYLEQSYLPLVVQTTVQQSF